MAATGVGNVLRDLKLTDEEVHKFERMLKDKKAIELLADYAKELSDPAVKAETDRYLRQLEREGRTGEVLGAGATLLVPEPGCAFKTRDAVTGARIYINVCTSPKMEPVRQRPSQDATRPGWHVEVPLSLGEPKQALPGDPSAAPARVWDTVVHPSTLQRAAHDPAFRRLLTEVVRERVSAAAGVKLVEATKQLATKYKALPGHEAPRVMAMRPQGTAQQQAALPTGPQGTAAAGSRQSPARVTGAPGPPAAEQASGRASTANDGGAPAVKGGGSAFHFPTPRRAAAVAPAAQAQAQRRHGTAAPSGGAGDEAARAAAAAAAAASDSAGAAAEAGRPTVPRHEIVHQGRVDLANAWADAGHGLAVDAPHAPRALLVRVWLPGVRGAGEVALDVRDADLSLAVGQRYALQLALPCAVQAGKGAARFDAARQVLSVTLPVAARAAAAPAVPSRSAMAASCGVRSSAVAEPGAEAGGKAAAAERTEEDNAGGCSGAGHEVRAAATATALGADEEPAAAVEPCRAPSVAGREAAGDEGCDRGATDAAVHLGVPPQAYEPQAKAARAHKTDNQLVWERLHATRGEAAPRGGAVTVCKGRASAAAGPTGPAAAASGGDPRQEAQPALPAPLLQPRVRCALVHELA